MQRTSTMEKLGDPVQSAMQRGLVRHPAGFPSSTTTEPDQVVVYSRLGDFHFQLPFSAAAKLSVLPEEEPKHKSRVEVEWNTLDNYHLVLEVVEWAMDLKIICRLLNFDASSCDDEPWIQDSLRSFPKSRLQVVYREFSLSTLTIANSLKQRRKSVTADMGLFEGAARRRRNPASPCD